MSEPLSVTPDSLRSVAADVENVSTQMKQVLSTLNGQLSGLGTPWGDDSTGDQFANGSQGYLAQHQNVNTNIGNQTQQLDSLSQSLTTSANNFEQHDQQS
jgi:WXG100 family type VII secretion target